MVDPDSDDSDGDGADVRYCLAAYCTAEYGHLAPHTPLHYLILEDWRQRNPSHATCTCHARPGMCPGGMRQ